MPMAEKIHIGTLSKKWRFECDRGHTNWFPLNGYPKQWSLSNTHAVFG